MIGKRARLAVVAALAVSAAAGIVLRRREGRLSTIEHGGSGPPTMVLLHGYGSSAGRWEPFTHTIHLPSRGRFVLPEGPERTSPPDGPPDGRAWWRLDLASHIPRGRSLPELSATRPPGLERAASLVVRLLEDLGAAGGEPIILGGFSQGAMVAAQVAFLSDQPIAALVLLSTTLVDEVTWEKNFARRRGLPVLLAHGRSDNILPFETADRLRAKLATAGLAVRWLPFDGGHEIPAEVVMELNAFIRDLGLTKQGDRP